MKIENIITIIILIILALFLLGGMIAPRFFACIEKPRWDSARSKITPIESAINVYKLNTGKLPPKLEDLVTCPAGLESVWHGPYLKEKQLYDSWDRKFIYNVYSGSYEIISYGEDGLPDGEGYDMDVYND
ncbi:MAG: type II secretion system protein GspG [Sedimentisphaerales bacterium]|nr:type II secretion system protein GspG [Sedimentisphaerales bacterium]